MAQVVSVNGLSHMDIKPGYKLCPHCAGKTACNCATCGTIMIKKEMKTKSIINEKAGVFDPMYKDVLIPTERQYTEFGVCKVCNGMGQIYDAEEDARLKKNIVQNAEATEKKRQNKEEMGKFYAKMFVTTVIILFLLGIGLIVYYNLPFIIESIKQAH